MRPRRIWLQLNRFVQSLGGFGVACLLRKRNAERKLREIKIGIRAHHWLQRCDRAVGLALICRRRTFVSFVSHCNLVLRINSRGSRARARRFLYAYVSERSQLLHLRRTQFSARLLAGISAKSSIEVLELRRQRVKRRLGALHQIVCRSRIGHQVVELRFRRANVEILSSAPRLECAPSKAALRKVGTRKRRLIPTSRLRHPQ